MWITCEQAVDIMCITCGLWITCGYTVYRVWITLDPVDNLWTTCVYVVDKLWISWADFGEFSTIFWAISWQNHHDFNRFLNLLTAFLQDF